MIHFSFETLNLKYLERTQAECLAGNSTGESEAWGRHVRRGFSARLISIQVVAEMLRLDKCAQEDQWRTEQSGGLKADTWVTPVCKWWVEERSPG